MLKHQGNCTCSCKGIYVLRGVAGMQREFTLPAHLHAKGKSFHDDVKQGQHVRHNQEAQKFSKKTTDTTS